MKIGTPLSYDPATRHATRDVLQELGAAPNRTLGQNFLIDKNALDRIVALADVQSEDHILEIGSGLGALTCRLVAHASQVVAIEKDKVLAQFLPTKLTQENFCLVPGDALKTNWDALGLPDANVKIVANLPYSISKPFLRRVYEEWRLHLNTATLMLQKEVAQRLVAAPGTDTYGPMAIMAALYSDTKIVLNLAPGAFWPPPDVSSAVIHVKLHAEPKIELEDEKFFWRVVTAAFSQRRKQLINTLRAISTDKTVLQSALAATNIDPQRRGETLSLEEFALLARNLKSITQKQ
jgi:16S rRNA (adenine1518-N6/adenine1519-N6)-dimethyltransferase